MLNPDIDSQDALMSWKSLNNNDLELLNPELNKSKSILGGALGRKISSTKPKVSLFFNINVGWFKKKRISIYS